MDNLTHTLIGVLVGEGAARISRTSPGGLTQPERRDLLVTMMAVGSNLPDLDFLYSTATGSKLDYLLHHRGHTHTFVGALLISALLVMAAELWIRKRHLSPAPADRLWLVLIAALAPALHIAMDMTNNYGVHPWWPFNNEWLYGDSVFIIEPLLWAAAAPLVFASRTLAARCLVALVLVAGVALTFLTGMVPVLMALGYTALVAVLLFAGFKLSPAKAVASGLGLWIAVTLVFLATSQLAARRVEALVSRTFSDADLLDHVVTPMPVNPVCWEVILVQREAEELVLRRGMYSILPSQWSANRCPGRSLDIPITAPLQRVAAANTPEVQWHGEIRSRIETLDSLWRENCRVERFMRFARAPWLADIEGETVLGDLRYDREKELGFAEIDIESTDERCPSYVPPWIPPRRDLLE